MSNIIPFNEIKSMAEVFCKSKLFGVQTPEQAAALMLVAQAEGRHPASVAMDYHIIQGRPSLKADAMLSRFQAAGGHVTWESMTDTKVSAKFCHPQGGKVEIDWTIERAKTAELLTKGGSNWKKYPRQMLRARVISEGVRAVFPGVLSGMYTPEEVQDFDTEKKEIKQADAKIIEPEKKAQQKQIEQNEIDYTIIPGGKNIGKKWADLDLPTLEEYLKHYVEKKNKPYADAVRSAIDDKKAAAEEEFDKMADEMASKTDISTDEDQMYGAGAEVQ